MEVIVAIVIHAFSLWTHIILQLHFVYVTMGEGKGGWKDERGRRRGEIGL